MIYTRTLTQKFRKVYFILPFPYIKGDIDVKINMKNLYKMKANVTVNNKQISEHNFIGSTLIEITELSLSDCENLLGCPIRISLELTHLYNLNDTKVPIEIVFSTSRKTPSILQKGVLRKTGINGNATDYYYIEISKDEEGEIILNFKRGNGIMFGKLVKKNNSENDINAWRKKVILPTENNNDELLLYNPITQKIKYEKSHTNICDKGCFLIIGVKNKESFLGYDSFFTLEYTIFIRYIDKKAELSKVAVNIPDNEYIYGSLEANSSNGQYDTYVYDIFDDYKEIEIEFKSEKAIMYYSLSAFEKSNDKNKIESKGNIIVKNIANIKKGNQLKLTVSSIELDKQNISIYTFKIRPIHKNKLSLLELSGDKPSICDANADSICNYYLPLSSFDGISQLILYSDSKDEVSIYITKTDSNYFGNCIDEECIKSALPGKKRFDLTSEKQNNTNYLIINPIYYQKSDIILISVTTRTKQLIPLYAVFKSYVRTTIPTLNTLQIINISPNQNQTLNLNDYMDSMSIKYIQGKGKINYDKVYKLEKGNNTTKILRSNGKNILTIENQDGANNLIIVLGYEINKNKINPARSSQKPSDDKKNNKIKILDILIIVLVLILVAVFITGIWILIKNKNEKDKLMKSIDKLSITLNDKEIDKRKPLLDTNELDKI